MHVTASHKQYPDCERGFSAQNRILTGLRNRLKPETQCKLMSVKLGEVDLMSALEVWRSAKPRYLMAQSQAASNLSKK